MNILGYNLNFGKATEVVNEQKEDQKEEVLKTKIVERQLYRISATVGKWRTALSQAENVYTPNRTPLMEVFQEIVLDTHLTAIVQSRLLAVTSQKWSIKDKSGKENEQLTEALNKDWLDNFVVGSLESIFYGYTLFQFDEIKPLEVGYLEQFPRQNVDPDRQLVKREHNNIGGVDFTQEPYSDLILFVGDRVEKGLYNKCAPLTMFKKDAWANWSDFQELFGIPPRIGRTDVRNPELRKNMDSALKNMGKLFYAVMDKEDTIELVESTKGDSYNVFKQLIDGVNKELSKIVLGQTGTTDEKAFSGSANVHERKEQMITRADCKFIERTINDKLLPLLALNGWTIPEGATFEYDKTEQISKADLIEFVPKLLENFDITEEYILENFNIPVKKKTLEQSSAEPVKNELIEVLNLSYSKIGLNELEVQNATEEELLTESEKEDLLEGVYNGVYTTASLPVFLYEATNEKLIEAVEKGYNTKLTGLEKKSDSYKNLRNLQLNIADFSSAKTYQQVKAYGIDIYDSNGVKRSFADFKREASAKYDTFNKHYLKTEFETAHGQSQSAREWQVIQSRKDALPLLRYKTQLDDRVRPEHQTLEGIVRNVEDSFWLNYGPRNGYNCRCYLEQIASGNITPINSLPEMREIEEVDPVFMNNAGISGKVFNNKHPYFKVPKADKELKENNFNLPEPSL